MAEAAIVVEDKVVAPQMPAIHNSPTLSLGPLIDRALKGIKEKTEPNASNDLRMLMKMPPPESASRPLVNFDVLNDNLIKGLMSCFK
jgi:hypothetical protein